MWKLNIYIFKFDSWRFGDWAVSCQRSSSLTRLSNKPHARIPLIISSSTAPSTRPPEQRSTAVAESLTGTSSRVNTTKHCCLHEGKLILAGRLQPGKCQMFSILVYHAWIVMHLCSEGLLLHFPCVGQTKDCDAPGIGFIWYLNVPSKTIFHIRTLNGVYLHAVFRTHFGFRCFDVRAHRLTADVSLQRACVCICFCFGIALSYYCNLDLCFYSLLFVVL